MNITEQIQQLPELLQESVEKHWQSFVELELDVSSVPDEVTEVLPRVWACSEFVMQICVRFPDVFLELALSGDLLITYEQSHYKNSIFSDLKQGDSEGLNKELRLFRRREMLRIVWRYSGVGRVKRNNK